MLAFDGSAFRRSEAAHNVLADAVLEEPRRRPQSQNSWAASRGRSNTSLIRCCYDPLKPPMG